MNFLEKSSKNPQVSNFMKMCPVRAEFSMQTDTTKLIFASEILDMPKNMKQIWFMILLSTPFYNSSWGIHTRLWDE